MMEGCLGWQGVLVEAQPTSFQRLLKNRGGSLNINMAACEEARVLSFSSGAQTYAKISDSPTGGAKKGRTVQVRFASCVIYMDAYIYIYIYICISHFFSNPAKVAAIASTTGKRGLMDGF